MPQESSPMEVQAGFRGGYRRARMAGGLQDCTWTTSGQHSLVSRCRWSYRLQIGTPAQET